MAIIDTSKGVRPCVEELARLENNRTFGKNKHSITRAFTYEDKVLREYQSRNLTFSYEGSGLFRITGTLAIDWTGGISILYAPDNCPIISYNLLGAPILHADQPDRERKIYRHYFLLNVSSQADIVMPEESTGVFNTFVYGSYSIPCTDGSNLTDMNLIVAIPSSGFSVGFLSYSVPYTVTPIFEEMQVKFQLYWTGISLPAGTVFNYTCCFNIYNLFSYFTPEVISNIFINYSGNARLTKILTECDVLDYINMDNLLNGLYTLSNGELKTISFNEDNFNTDFPPYTEAYLYETPTNEGE